MAMSVEALLAPAFRRWLAPIGLAVEKETGRVWNPGHFFDTWAEAVTNGRAHFHVAKDERSNPLGVMIFSVLPDDFTGRRIGYENHWFVIPEYRSQSVGPRLFKSFLKTCEDRGCREIYAFSPKVNVGVFYKRVGFKIHQAAYKKVVS